MTFNFDEIIDRQSSDSIKWNLYPRDVLPLWVADADFRSPEPVVEALTKRIQQGVFGYPKDPPGLSEAVVNWMKIRHNWSITSDQVSVLPAIISGFNLAAQAFGRGRALLFHTPAYPPFFQVASNAGITQVTNDLAAGPTSYEIDFDVFEAAAKNASIFLLCNPQNPSGRVFTRPELEKMADICLRHNLMICSDEIHSDLVYSEQPHIPIASLSAEVAARTVTLVAPSKTFNVAGLKTAIAITPSQEIRQQLMTAEKGLMGHANLLGMVSAEACYRSGQPWLEALLVYLQSNRDELLNTLKTEMPAIHCYRPQGTYLAWLDCRALHLEESPAQFFVREARVGLNEGADFGPQGKGFVRLNFACPRATLQEALKRMKDALQRNHLLG